MKPLALRLFALLVPLLGSACSSTLVREGVWKLSFVDVKLAKKDKETGRMLVKPYPMDNVVVKVRVGPAEEGEILELIKLNPPAAEGEAAGQPPAKPVNPMYADVKQRD